MKLFPTWRGPFRVLSRLSDVNYRIINLHRRKDVHVQRLKPYYKRMEDEEPEIYTPGTKLLQRQNEVTEIDIPETNPDSENHIASKNVDEKENDFDATPLQRSQRKRRPPPTFH